MKKTLALILALIMMLSVALVACGDKEEPTEPNDDFFGDIEPGDETGEGDETNESGNNIPTTNSTFVAVNDTVYVLINANIYADSRINSNKVVAQVPFGVAISRQEKNNKWSKVTYNGVEGYIPNELVGSISQVTFKDVEEGTTVKPANLQGASHLVLRKTPLYLPDPDVVNLDDFNSKSILGQAGKDAEIVVLAVSEDGNWLKVKCQAKARLTDGKYAEELTEITGYCMRKYTNYKTGESGTAGSDDFV